MEDLYFYRINGRTADLQSNETYHIAALDESPVHNMVMEDVYFPGPASDDGWSGMAVHRRRGLCRERDRDTVAALRGIQSCQPSWRRRPRWHSSSPPWHHWLAEDLAWTRSSGAGILAAAAALVATSMLALWNHRRHSAVENHWKL